MASPFLFTVLTDFKFEIGSALLGTKQLQGAVGNLSSAADDALISFQKLGAGIAFNMGLGSGGILSIIKVAVQSADKFQQSQLSFANLISANQEHLVGPIDTFNQRLAVSSKIMSDIAKQAQEFALPTGPMVEMTKTLAAILTPKGLAGNNFSTAIDMSKNLLKSAPNLGIDPNEVQGQLLRAIEGGASLGDTLFRRLASETSAFREIPGGSKGGSKAFNALDAAKRVDILGRALAQFASDTDVLSGRVNTISGQLQRLAQLVSPLEYVTNIFRPLGEVLVPLIVETIKQLADMLDKHGRILVKNISFFIKEFVKTPEQIATNLLQLRQVSNDVGQTKSLLNIVAGLTIVGHALRFFGLQAAATSALMGGASFAWRMLVAGLRFAMPLLARGLILLAPLLVILGKVVLIMAAIFAVMQLFSRAMAIAQVDDAKEMPRITAEFTRNMALFRQVMENTFGWLFRIFDSVADAISPLFRLSYWLDFLNETFYAVIYLVSLLNSAFMGLQAAITAFMQSFTSFEFLSDPLSMFSKMGEAFNAQFEDSMRRNLLLPDERNTENNAVQMQNINIGKVEIRNDFKENQEPDRIAFTIKEQLLKAALNPSQSRGRSLAGGIVGE
jgi:hypothetical protein